MLKMVGIIFETICDVADGLLVKKVQIAARNIIEKALCLIDRRRGLYKNFLSDTIHHVKTKGL